MKKLFAEFKSMNKLKLLYKNKYKVQSDIYKDLDYSVITYNTFHILWEELLGNIKNVDCNEPYHGLRIASMEFIEPIAINDRILIYAMMLLILKYAYTTKSDMGKLTMGFSMNINNRLVAFTLSNAITFRKNGENIDIYHIVEKNILLKAEEYDYADISKIFIRIYLTDMITTPMPTITDDELEHQLWDSIHKPVTQDIIDNKIIQDYCKNNRYPKIITQISKTSIEREPFIVADTETVLMNEIHVPYAIGFLVVKPGDQLHNAHIETYFSEDYPNIIWGTFEERSQKMMCDFIERLVVVVKENPPIKTVYFHNFGRFDGILLLKHLTEFHKDKYTINSLMRNHLLYEISIFRNKKLLFRLRDTYTLLPSSLNELASFICPEFGVKGKIEHSNIEVSNLMVKKTELLEYMKQDIRLLGGVMLKAQEIYWKHYHVDIVTKLTLSSLALTIFRMHYYDPVNWPIHVPTRNQDTFIRRGYYGGHADTYIPFGVNLYYYDVNSLYPYIMKSYPMPGGRPVWHGKLHEKNLDNMFGFIEAYVECPQTIKRPFLPFRSDSNPTLIFPTGSFVGVYYSEELKYAKTLGYNILPLSGYLFEKKPSPFEDIISSLFEKRCEAKIKGNKAMSYIYKIIMNSLYGRFGINPISTITEICNIDEYNNIIKNKDIINGEKLTDDFYIVTYKSNTELTPDSNWAPPRISAIQLSAAITACARIHMYPYISRDDCYYTDTDSVVLGNPLPDDEVSPTELGKMKLEYLVQEGIFLAPKSYFIHSQVGDKYVKHKGIAKSVVNDEWFKSQLDNIKREIQTTVSSDFKIDWKKLNITKKETIVNLSIKTDYKRHPVFINDQWVGTRPLDITYYDGKEAWIFKYQQLKLIDQNNKNMIMKDQYIKLLEKRISFLEGHLPKPIIYKDNINDID